MEKVSSASALPPSSSALGVISSFVRFLTFLLLSILLTVQHNGSLRYDRVHRDVHSSNAVSFRGLLAILTKARLSRADLLSSSPDFLLLSFVSRLIGIADPAFWTRFGVHYGLFLGAVRGGATAAQFNYWIEKGVLGLNG